MQFVRYIVMLLMLLGSSPVLAEETGRFYFEPEAGFFGGRFHKSSSSMIMGLQAGFSTGYQHSRYQIGVEAHGRYFETSESNLPLYFTNIPIGISLRISINENWRVLAAWYWDDVLYKEFRIAFQEGIKIPKDYETAYEGPGSWRIGLSHKIRDDLQLNHTVFPQKFSTFKKRRPAVVTGDVDPAIYVMSYAMTLSYLF